MLICWDLRFQLPITNLSHPRGIVCFCGYLFVIVVNCFRVVVNILLFLGARVRRLATHPTEQSWVVSAVQGNNEVTVWDLETGARRQALWASHTPPLSQTQVCRRLITLYDAFRYGH